MSVDGALLGLDHVALPLVDVEAMTAFYEPLGLDVSVGPFLVRVQVGDQMINFHHPEYWRADVPLRAHAAVPPCGDLCLVWRGSELSLAWLLDRAAAVVIEGPVAREGGRGVVASSVYVRDPDGNLIEFMTYPDDAKEHVHVG